jgi:hypothetical protein
MKTLIKPLNFLTGLLSLACALALLPSYACGQDAQPAAVLRAGLNLQISHGQLFDPGGAAHGEATLSNVVAMLTAKYSALLASGTPEPTVNIVIGDGLGKLKIDDLQLQDAPLDLALQALRVASGNKFVISEQRSKENPSHLYMLETIEPPKLETRVEAFNLSGYIRHIERSCPDTNKWDEQIEKNVEEIQQIVSAVLEEQRLMEDKNMEAPQRGPRFRFFKESELLIVIGSPEVVKTAAKIIFALPGGSAPAAQDQHELLLQKQQNLSHDQELLEELKK